MAIAQLVDGYKSPCRLAQRWRQAAAIGEAGRALLRIAAQKVIEQAKERQPSRHPVLRPILHREVTNAFERIFTPGLRAGAIDRIQMREHDMPALTLLPDAQ